MVCPITQGDHNYCSHPGRKAEESNTNNTLETEPAACDDGL